jgi:hypothetical protein
MIMVEMRAGKGVHVFSARLQSASLLLDRTNPAAAGRFPETEPSCRIPRYDAAAAAEEPGASTSAYVF